MKVADFRKKLKESLEQELAEGESVTHMLLYLNEETFIDEPGELLAEEARCVSTEQAHSSPVG